MTVPNPTTPPPGTPEWAQWAISTFSDEDKRAIADVLAVSLVPYPSLWRGRVRYALACHDRHWCGWQARLVWTIMEALVKDDMDADIPF